MTRKIGYARTAVISSEIEEQVGALKSAGCSAVFTDGGKAPAAGLRPGLEKALSNLERGDVLVVCSLDRLSRDFSDLCEIARDLAARGVQLESLDGHSLPTDPT